MGLTLHWAWKMDVCRARAREILCALHRFAQTLGFENCFEPVEIDWSRPPLDSHEGLLRQHSGWPVVARIESPDGIPTSVGDSLDPSWSICFFTTDPGLEPAFFGFGQYAEHWEPRGLCLPSKAHGLCWASSCKTQYASMPQLGGESNFLAAHQRLVRVLDEARRLGIPVEVTDDGEYWETRSEDRLRSKLSQYNNLLAAFAGHFKDRLGSEAIEGPIRSHPAFERLEAAGNAEFGHKFAEADAAVIDMLRQAEGR